MRTVAIALTVTDEEAALFTAMLIRGLEHFHGRPGAEELVLSLTELLESSRTGKAPRPRAEFISAAAKAIPNPTGSTCTPIEGPR
ncbi:MAG TPA: hypothetical protein VK403_11910 [Allosphingosinicella sp.]|nr:hypothetical protein [Allosphingosinicella sp.]